MNPAASDHAHVEIGEAHGNEAAPCKKHVVLVQKTKEAPGGEAGAAQGSARKAIELAAGKMTERVAGKRGERKQRDVERENTRAETDTKAPIEKKGADRLRPQKNYHK